MPLATGTFSKREDAQSAIDNEDWTLVGYESSEEVEADGLVGIDEINIK